MTPAHLRSIPGEKTIAQEAKERFRQRVGRDPIPEELEQIASDLTGYHRASNQEQIALSLAAYEGKDPGLLTGEQMMMIEDPGKATTFDIEDKWANEIDLNTRQEGNAETYKRMLNATMGGQTGLSQQTSARYVQQLGAER